MLAIAPIDHDVSATDLMHHGVVAVHHRGRCRSRAVCSCGWASRQRYLRAVAMQDAWTHAVQEHCEVSYPLVIPA